MTRSNRQYLDRLKAEVEGMRKKLDNLSKSYEQKRSRLKTQQARANQGLPLTDSHGQTR
jgi:outer membrane murein-binding lipoprotein Lpp